MNPFVLYQISEAVAHPRVTVKERLENLLSKLFPVKLGKVDSVARWMRFEANAEQKFDHIRFGNDRSSAQLS